MRNQISEWASAHGPHLVLREVHDDSSQSKYDPALYFNYLLAIVPFFCLRSAIADGLYPAVKTRQIELARYFWTWLVAFTIL